MTITNVTSEELIIVAAAIRTFLNIGSDWISDEDKKILEKFLEGVVENAKDIQYEENRLKF